jgi:hypothetical protein
VRKRRINDMADSSDIFCVLTIIGMFTIIGVILISIIPINTVVTKQDVNLWYTQAPFGVIYSDISGSFVWGSGALSTSPGEAYSIKYWSNDQLKSLVLDARETPIVVDNSFKITITLTHSYNVFGLDIIEPKATYVLHLPSLPTNVSVGMLAP